MNRSTLLATVVRHAHRHQGRGASAVWLSTVPEPVLDRILELEISDREECGTLILLTLSLLEAEGRTPVRAGDVERLLKTVLAAVAVERKLREGNVAITPPIRSIFDPGDSVIDWVGPRSP